MSTAPDWSAVSRRIALAEASGMVVGVSICTPEGARFSHRGERRFRAASTIKIAVMVALFRLVEAGGAALDDVRELAAAEKVGGSGVLRHLHDGARLTLGDLLYLMMSISDNTATNLLIDTVGLSGVAAVLDGLGLTGSALQRKMMGVASAPGRENWGVPDEFADLVAALFDHRAAPAASCERMIATLELQQNERRIARLLPREGRPRWGSKTGSLDGVCNDVGFIMTARGPLVLAVFCEGVADPLEGERAIGEIAAAALGAVG